MFFRMGNVRVESHHPRSSHWGRADYRTRTYARSNSTGSASMRSFPWCMIVWFVQANTYVGEEVLRFFFTMVTNYQGGALQLNWGLLNSNIEARKNDGRL